MNPENRIKPHPAPLRIEGMTGEKEDKDLGAVLDKFAGNWSAVARNKSRFREVWEEFLPTEIYDKGKKVIKVEHEAWSVAFVPRVAVRKSFPNNVSRNFEGSVSPSTLPYFLVVLNSARDDRPQEEVPRGEDLLQKNVLDRGMIMGEIGHFFLCPNGFPYHKYASLLISKEKREQKGVTPEDITDWLRFSFLTNQQVFFNSPGAGASRPERFHAQVVDPEALRFEGRSWNYPFVNENIVSKQRVKDGIYELKGYAIDALVFVGKDAPYQASRMVMKLEDWRMAYNVIVNNNQVYVIGRNSKREKSDCIGKNIGGYECSGVILVGNIEERVLENQGLERIVHGNEVFSELDYETICSNLSAASIPVAWMKDLL